MYRTVPQRIALTCRFRGVPKNRRWLVGAQRLPRNEELARIRHEKRTELPCPADLAHPRSPRADKPATRRLVLGHRIRFDTRGAQVLRGLGGCGAQLFGEIGHIMEPT